MCWSPTRCCEEQFQTGTLPNRLKNICKKKKVTVSICLVAKWIAFMFLLLWSRLCNNKPSLNHSSSILCSLELEKKKKSNHHLNQPRVFICAKAGIAPTNSGKCSIYSPWCHQKIQSIWRKLCMQSVDGKTALKSCDLLPTRQAALTTLLVISSQIHKSKLRLWWTETECEKCANAWWVYTTFMLIMDMASSGLKRKRIIGSVLCTTFCVWVWKICICEGTLTLTGRNISNPRWRLFQEHFGACSRQTTIYLQYTVCWKPIIYVKSRWFLNGDNQSWIWISAWILAAAPFFTACHWGMFMLCDRTVGVLANESLAQRYSSRTWAPLQGAFREIRAGGAASGKW